MAVPESGVPQPEAALDARAASREVLLPPPHCPPDEGLDGDLYGSDAEVEETRVAGKAGERVQPYWPQTVRPNRFAMALARVPSRLSRRNERR